MTTATATKTKSKNKSKASGGKPMTEAAVRLAKECGAIEATNGVVTDDARLQIANKCYLACTIEGATYDAFGKVWTVQNVDRNGDLREVARNRSTVCNHLTAHAWLAKKVGIDESGDLEFPDMDKKDLMILMQVFRLKCFGKKSDATGNVQSSVSRDWTGEDFLLAATRLAVKAKSKLGYDLAAIEAVMSQAVQIAFEPSQATARVVHRDAIERTVHTQLARASTLSRLVSKINAPIG